MWDTGLFVLKYLVRNFGNYTLFFIPHAGQMLLFGGFNALIQRTIVSLS